MKKGIAVLVFCLTTAFTIALTWQIFSHFSGGDFSEVLLHIAGIPASIWILLLPLTTAFYLLDWLRFKSLLKVLGYPLSFLNGLKLTGVSYFVTSLTPTAELHTPAMVFMLSKQKVPIPQALAASVTKSIYMVLWICAVSYGALLIDHEVPLPKLIHQNLSVLTLPLLGMTALLALIAFFPRLSVEWIQNQSRRLNEGSLLRKVLLAISHSAESLSKIGKSGSLQHLICHAASIGFLFVYITVGYVLARYFGINISYGRAITVFSTSLMVAYLSPVPGSIGVTELTSSYMLNPNLTSEGMAVSLTLRILCWYLVTFPGGLILANEFRQPFLRSFHSQLQRKSEL